MSAVIESSILGNPRLAAVCLDALLKSFVVLAFAGGLCLAWPRRRAAICACCRNRRYESITGVGKPACEKGGGIWQTEIRT